MLEDPFADPEEERAGHRRFVAWLAVLLALVLAGGIVVAHAAPVYRSMSPDGQPAMLRLLDKPCTNEKVRAILQKLLGLPTVRKFKAAELTWGGARYASCWIEFNKVIYSIDEAGDPMEPLPRELFRDDAI